MYSFYWFYSIILSDFMKALCHMGLSYPDIVQSVIDKVTIKGDIFQTTSSKVLQSYVTLLSILAKRTKNRTMFLQVKSISTILKIGLFSSRKFYRKSMFSMKIRMFSHELKLTH